MVRINLPWDLIEEILSRLPAKSLVRLCSTSKQWNTLLKSARFVKMHSANAPKESLIIILKDDKVYLARARWTLVGPSDDTSIIRNNVASSVKLASQFYLQKLHLMSSQVCISDVFHCDGLLLCTTIRTLMVCNPCAGETKWIKPIRNSYKASDLYALGYDYKSSCKNYKVLRVNSRPPFADNTYEIYDFTTDSWRVLGATTDWLIIISNGVSVKGNTYWVARDSSPTNSLFLLSFDFSTERFRKLSLPHDLHYYLYQGLSVVRKEQLCVCGSFLNDLHVWVTTINTGSVLSWRKLVKVKASFNMDDLSCRMSFLATEQSEDVVCCNKFIQVDRHGATVNSTCRSSNCSMLLNYVPSLAQIQQDTHDL